MSAPDRGRPDIIVGRSGPDGGDWLADTLACHPDIAAIPEAAELALNPSKEAFPGSGPFATTAVGSNAADAFEALGRQAVGTGSSTLWQAANALLLPHLPFVVGEVLPDARIVFCVRDPVDLVADLWHHMPRGVLAPTLAEAVAECEAAMRESSRFEVRGRWPDHFAELPLRRTLLEHGMYGPVLSRWVRVLGQERVLAVPLANFAVRPKETIERVLGFLGFADVSTFAQTVEPLPWERWPAAGEADRQILAPRFAAAGRELAKHLEHDASAS